MRSCLRTGRRNPALTGAARSGIRGGGPLKRLSLTRQSQHTLHSLRYSAPTISASSESRQPSRWKRLKWKVFRKNAIDRNTFALSTQVTRPGRPRVLRRCARRNEKSSVLEMLQTQYPCGTQPYFAVNYPHDFLKTLSGKTATRSATRGCANIQSCQTFFSLRGIAFSFSQTKAIPVNPCMCIFEKTGIAPNSGCTRSVWRTIRDTPARS